MYSFRTLSPAKADLEKGMKVVATTVGSKGPESQVHNQERLDAAKQALINAKQMLADVLVLPGGFFTSHDSQSRQRIANSLISKAEEFGIAVVFGVDEEAEEPRKVKAKRKKRKGGKGGFPSPMYGYARSHTENMSYCLRQRSTNRDDQWVVSDEMCKEVRILKIGDEALGVLMCGEIFNQRIRNAIIGYSLRPKVVADVAHVGQGFRVGKAMKKLCDFGLASICSVHVKRRFAMKHCCIPKKGFVSSRDWDRVVDGPPRIELKLWEF